MGARPEVTAAAGDPIQLTPLWLAPDEPMVGRLRDVVLGDRSLRAAFVYRRAVVPADGADTADLLRPAIGILTYSGRPAPRTVARVLKAAGMIHGFVPTVVALDRDGVAAVLTVACPIGAGGDLEAEMARYNAAGVGRYAGKAAPALRLALPVAVVRDGDRRFVTAFSSDLALLSTMPPARSAIRIRGAVLASSVPDGVDIALDPGCALTAAIGASLVKVLGRPTL